MLRRLVLIRLGVGLLTLWAVSLVVFLGTQLLPGDAARVALGHEALDDLGHERDAALALGGLGGDADLHRARETSRPVWRRSESGR